MPGPAWSDRLPGAAGRAVARRPVTVVRAADVTRGLVGSGGPTAGSPRVARAGVFGIGSVCLSVAAHVGGGAGRPALVLVLAAAALITRVAYGLADRQRSFAAVGSALVVTQVLLHACYALSSHHATAGHHMVAPADLVPGAGGWASTGTMTLAHLAAAAGTAWLLRRAERLLWAAAALRDGLPRSVAHLAALLVGAGARLRRSLVAALAVAPSAGRLPAGTPAGVVPPVRPPGLPLGRTTRRRGPPTRSSVVLRPRLAMPAPRLA
jgi:hypothetical protein